MLKYYAKCADSRVRVYYTINPINVMEVWNINNPESTFKLRLHMNMLDTFMELTKYVHERRRAFLKERAERKKTVRGTREIRREEISPNMQQ